MERSRWLVLPMIMLAVYLGSQQDVVSLDHTHTLPGENTFTLGGSGNHQTLTDRTLDRIHTYWNGSSNVLYTNEYLGINNDGWIITVTTGGRASGFTNAQYTTYSGTLNVQGTNGQAYDIKMLGNINVSANGSLTGTNEVTGNISVSGSGTIGGENTATGQISISGTATIQNNTELTSTQTGGNGIVISGSGANYNTGVIGGNNVEMTTTNSSVTISNATFGINAKIDATNGNININNDNSTNQYVYFGTVTEFNANTGSINVNRGTGNDYAYFGSNAEWYAYGSITVNILGGGDTAIFGSDAKLTAQTGNIATYEGTQFGSGAVLNAVRGSVFGSGTYYGQGSTINATANIGVQNSNVGDNARWTAQNHVVIVNTEFGEDANITARNDMNITKTDGHTNHMKFGDDAILRAGNEIVITGMAGVDNSVSFGDNAEVTAGGALIINYADFGGSTGARLTAGGNVQVTNTNLGANILLTTSSGSMSLNNVTAGDRTALPGASNIRSTADMTIRNSNFGQNNHFESTGGSIYGTNSTFGSNSIIDADINVGLYSSDIGSNVNITAASGYFSSFDTGYGSAIEIQADHEVQIGGTSPQGLSRFGNGIEITAGNEVEIGNTVFGNGIEIKAGGHFYSEDTSYGDGVEIDARNEVIISGSNPDEYSRFGDGIEITSGNEIEIYNTVFGHTVDLDSGNHFYSIDSSYGSDTKINAAHEIVIQGTSDGLSDFGDRANITGGHDIIIDNTDFGTNALVTSTGGSVYITDSTFGNFDSSVPEGIFADHDLEMSNNIFGENGTFTATSGHLYSLNNHFGDNALLTAGEEIIIAGDALGDSRFGDGAKVTAGHEVEIYNTIFGNDANIESLASSATIIGSRFGDFTAGEGVSALDTVTLIENRFGSNGTFTSQNEELIAVDNHWGHDTTLESGKGMYIYGSSDLGDTTFGFNATIDAGADLEIINAEFGSELGAGPGMGATITAGGDALIANSNFWGDNHSITAGESVLMVDVHMGKDSEINGGSDVTIGQGMNAAGDRFEGRGTEIGTGLTVESGGKFTAYGSNTVIEGGYDITAADDVLLAGGVTLRGDSVSGGGNSITTSVGDILITGARLENAMAGAKTEISTASGNILISMDSLAQFGLIDEGYRTYIGNYTEITTDLGNISIYGHELADGTVLTLNIGENSLITSVGGGDVYLKDIVAGQGTVISTQGGDNNVWVLTGDYTDMKGTVDLGGEKDTVYIDGMGHYNIIDNTAGDANIYVSGGYIDTIRNSVAGVDTTITLLAHNNEYGDTEQPVKHIEGDVGSTDKLVVASGRRFTEYEDIAHNNNGFENSPDAWNAHVTSIKDYNNLTIARGSDTQRTGLEIGVFEGDNTQTLLDVETIELNAYADLFIHGEGIIHNVGSIKTYADSVLWIDRTTLAFDDGLGTGSTQVEIGASGMITGWNDNGANIVGDLYVYGGGIIKPYSLEHYNQEFLQNTDLLYGEGIYTINAGKGLIVEGNIGLEGSATLASRMFAEYDSWVSVNNGTVTESFQADYLQGSDVTFYGKMEFDPTFGNDNELGAKQMFNLYEGDGVSTENTYYYSIVRSDDEIKWYNPDTGIVESAVGLDPNTLFNNQIIKSDMLGEWYFELNDDGTEVLLRYRLLAKHPTQGGISADMKEPNARNAAEQIDRIRYPYDHEDLAVRYDGDMKKAYRELSTLHPDLYPNYKHYYIEDFEQLLLNIQNVIGSGAALNQAIRKLHPEPYADIASQNLQTMDQFIRTRQQHGMTTLWQVEVENYDEAVRLAEARAAKKEGSDSAYASLFGEDEYFCGVEQFVCNPVRWWAAGFGTDGKQKNVGTEYGWDVDSWGGAVGMVKEYGDLYLGGTVGYSRVNQDWKDLSATSKTDSFLADVVVGYRIGNGFIEAHGNYGWYEHTINRDVSFSGYTGHARGEYNDQAWGGGLRIGHQQMLGCGWLFVPTIGVNYMETKSDKFTESGRYNMSVLLDFRKHDIRKRNVRVPIQARLNKSFALGTFVLTPEVRGSVTGILGNRQAKATARFVGDPSADGYFTAVGLETGRWAAQLGASLELSRRGRFSLSGNYDYTWSQRSYEHSYSLMAGYNF